MTTATKNPLIIASRTIGTRMVMGTEWPVEIIVIRHRYFGHSTWTVATLCNGISGSFEEFPTRKAALEFAGIE